MMMLKLNRVPFSVDVCRKWIEILSFWFLGRFRIDFSLGLFDWIDRSRLIIPELTVFVLVYIFRSPVIITLTISQ